MKPRPVPPITDDHGGSEAEGRSDDAFRRFPRARANLKKIMAAYSSGLTEGFRNGKFVVWIAALFPVELLHGFDLVIAVPENHAAMLAARGMGAERAEAAEHLGFSMDLCSYARVDLGSHLETDIGGLPSPDLIISDSNNCSLLVKWFDVYRRERNIPHFVVDVPFCYQPQRDEDRAYITSQFKELIGLIEELSGQVFDPDSVRRAIRHTNEANAHWHRFLSLARQRPAGITAFDTFAHMAPFISAHRGTPVHADHFRIAADEATQHITDGVFPVPEEKYRLLWDNIAPWHQLGAMSRRLTELGAAVVYAPYTGCIGTVEGKVERFAANNSDPLDTLARSQNFTVTSYGMGLRLEALVEAVQKYKIDGVIFSSNRSCKVYSVMQMDTARKLKEQTGVSTVSVDVDHADPRKYSEEGVFVRIEALLEEIGGK